MPVLQSSTSGPSGSSTQYSEREKLVINTPRWALPLLKPSRYKGAYGGRYSGKSYFFAEMLVERCLMKKTNAVGIREVQRSLNQSVKKLIEEKIVAMGVSDAFTVKFDRIIAPYGGLIIFEGMSNNTAESIKSLQGFDIAWIEEAQSLSGDSLDALRPTIRAPGAEMWFGWNPKYPSDPVDEFFRGPKPHPDSIVVRSSYMDNPWRTKEMMDEIEYDKTRDPDKYAHVWLGEYLQKSEARVFKNWSIEEFERPAGTIFRLGADWGFANDPSTLVRCSIEGNRLYVDYEAYMVGCEIVNLPSLFARVPESSKWFITADSARPETIDYMRKNGYPKMNRATKGKNSLYEGVEWLKSFDLVIHPRCVHTIDELTLYSYKTDQKTGEIFPLLKDTKNHVIDALRYSCEGARKAGAEPEYNFVPIPVANRWAL